MIRDRLIPTPSGKNTAEKGELETLMNAASISANEI